MLLKCPEEFGAGLAVDTHFVPSYGVHTQLQGSTLRGTGIYPTCSRPDLALPAGPRKACVRAPRGCSAGLLWYGCESCMRITCSVFHTSRLLQLKVYPNKKHLSSETLLGSFSKFKLKLEMLQKLFKEENIQIKMNKST